MKKALLCIFAVLVYVSALFPFVAYAAPNNSAASAILIHANTGQVLFEKNADSQMLIASTTKIMTALVVLENCSPDEMVKILPEHTNVEGSSMYIKAGESYTVSDLLYGILLASGNDAATALAYHCGGSIEGFAQMMNDKAREMGLCNSSFKNPHGLDAKDHYSSAGDLATITCEAMKNELFAKIISTKLHTVDDKTYMNHNKLLWNYDGALGGKTGYTMAAGRSLVSCAERDGLRLICVTLSDPNDWNDHKELCNWAFETFQYKSVLPMGAICQLPVISGENDAVGIITSADTRILVKKNSKIDFTLELPEFVYAGIKAGDCAGRVFITADDELVGEFPLIYNYDVNLSSNAKLSAWERFKLSWFRVNKYRLLFKGID